MSNINELTTALFKLVVAVVLIAVPILLKPLFEKLAKIIETKIGSIDEAKKEKIFNDAVKFLTDLVNTTVAYLEQEYAKELREKIANGTATREDLFKLKDKALIIIQAQTSDTIKELIAERISDVDSYIDNLISQAVLKIKENNK